MGWMQEGRVNRAVPKNVSGSIYRWKTSRRLMWGDP